MTLLLLSLAVAIIAVFTVFAAVLVVRGPAQVRDLERREWGGGQRAEDGLRSPM